MFQLLREPLLRLLHRLALGKHQVLAQCQWLLRQNELRHYCLFIGYPRSGHSLFAQLLNAHPDVVIADELVASERPPFEGDIPHARYSSRRALLYCLLTKAKYDFVEREKGIFGGYSYSVPNQWQGRVRKLHVIGDKCAYETTRFLYQKDMSVQSLADFVELPVKIFHVVRNPFDAITRRYFRNAGSIDDLIHEYFNELCPTVMAVLKEHPDQTMTLYLEDLIQNPREQLGKAIQFLELSAEPQYLDDCAGIVWKAPGESFDSGIWNAAQIATVQERIRQVPFLKRYRS